MKFISSLVIIITFASCSEKSHPDAEALCGCYTELHRAHTDDQINRIADSCNTIHITIINKYKSNQEGKENFEEAYKNCQ